MSDKRELILKDGLDNIIAKCPHKGIKIYGSSRVTPAIGFDYPEYGTKIHKEKLDKDPLGTMIKEQIAIEASKSNPFEWTAPEFKFRSDNKQVARVCVDVSIERYEDLEIEINENNELVVKIGKVKLGGCK